MRVTRLSLVRRGSTRSNTVSSVSSEWISKSGAPAPCWSYSTCAAPSVRNMATVGGHLAHGDPHMDLPPLLSALGANVTIAGPKGERGTSVEAIYAGYLETTLARDELITALSVPAMGSRRAVYLKCTTRPADDWPALGMAVVLDGQRASIVLSAATDKPTRLAAAEKILSASSLDDKLIQRAADAAREVRIEGDLHGSAAYKKHLIGVYLRRAIHEARNASR